MYEIIPGLYLSSFKDASESELLSTAFVVNCTKDLKMLSTKSRRVAIDDNGNPREISALFTEFANGTVLGEIDTALKAGTPVIVHCLAGQQRSPAVICGYMLRYSRKSVEDAILHIRSKKPDAMFWKVNFQDTLERYAMFLGKPPKMMA